MLQVAGSELVLDRNQHYTYSDTNHLDSAGRPVRRTIVGDPLGDRCFATGIYTAPELEDDAPHMAELVGSQWVVLFARADNGEMYADFSTKAPGVAHADYIVVGNKDSRDVHFHAILPGRKRGQRVNSWKRLVSGAPECFVTAGKAL